MRPCSCSDVSLVLALGFAAFVAASAATTHGGVFYVGDTVGSGTANRRRATTTGQPATTSRSSTPLCSSTRRARTPCWSWTSATTRHATGKTPSTSYATADSAYMLGRTGPLYFISSDVGRCKQGQKLMVVITAETTAEPPAGSQAPSLSPSVPPYTSIAASSKYYMPPLAAPSPFEEPSVSPSPSPAGLP
ncbi:unnamed protein product [Urochloa decumbens]|uniref:Phytocyanin domain-containing protein n=1 Tax=Urochloa decumbens TaxID=240449 RepID=A0ABC8Z3A8_9POAL